MKAIAVVVTYNRLTLLKESIAALLAQTRPTDAVLVINNNSTDGTEEWLATQPVTMITQENNGGASGFYRGIKEAYTQGADWVWLMDDDTIPSPGALEQLLRCAGNSVLNDAGFFLSKATWTNGEPHIMNLPDIRTFVQDKPFNLYDQHGVLRVQAASFVSLLVSRKAVQACGLPVKEFYIWLDDFEYTSRITRAGFPGYYAGRSVVLHKTATNYSADLFTAQRKEDWKHIYGVRNALFVKKMRKGTFKFWTSVLKNYLIVPFTILKRRKDDKIHFIKVVWKGTSKAIGFNPQIEKLP